MRCAGKELGGHEIACADVGGEVHRATARSKRDLERGAGHVDEVVNNSDDCETLRCKTSTAGEREETNTLAISETMRAIRGCDDVGAGNARAGFARSLPRDIALCDGLEICADAPRLTARDCLGGIGVIQASVCLDAVS